MPPERAHGNGAAPDGKGAGMPKGPAMGGAANVEGRPHQGAPSDFQPFVLSAARGAGRAGAKRGRPADKASAGADDGEAESAAPKRAPRVRVAQMKQQMQQEMREKETDGFKRDLERAERNLARSEERADRLDKRLAEEGARVEQRVADERARFDRALAEERGLAEKRHADECARHAEERAKLEAINERLLKELSDARAQSHRHQQEENVHKANLMADMTVHIAQSHKSAMQTIQNSQQSSAIVLASAIQQSIGRLRDHGSRLKELLPPAPLPDARLPAEHRTRALHEQVSAFLNRTVTGADSGKTLLAKIEAAIIEGNRTLEEERRKREASASWTEQERADFARTLAEEEGRLAALVYQRNMLAEGLLRLFPPAPATPPPPVSAPPAPAAAAAVASAQPAHPAAGASEQPQFPRAPAEVASGAGGKTQKAK
jgi:hypothetical protein